MNKDRINLVLWAIALVVIILMCMNTCQIQKDAADENEKLKKSIIASDKMINESAGQYAKLVDYYKSERDLVKELKGQNEDLYRTIKKQDERLLSITSAIIKLDEKVVKGFGKPDPIDTNKINFSLRYPDEKDPFIFWDGSVNKKTAAYNGKFSFGALPIKIVLTEESRGLWKSRLVGPSWLKVDSLSIISIPPKDYPTVEPKKIQWLIGGAYYHGLNSIGQGIGINVGLNLYDRHNLLFGANSLQQVSVGYVYKIKTFKRNR